MNGGVDPVVVYTLLLAASLWLNGLVIVAAQPLPVLFRPLRSPRLLGGSLAIDVVLVPATMLALAWLWSGITDEMRVGLVVIAAASAGPIGSVLTRIVRGDQPLAVSLITVFGGLNLVTVPVLSALLLRATVPVPLGPVITSMALLVIAPLVCGYVWARVSARRQASGDRKARQLRFFSAASSLSLAVAIMIAVTFDYVRVVELLLGPIGLLSVITMTVITVATYLVGHTWQERVTLMVVLNARGAGLALIVGALHFGDVDDVQATVLAFSLVTQAVPALLVLIAKRWLDRPRTSRTAV